MADDPLIVRTIGRGSLWAETSFYVAATLERPGDQLDIRRTELSETKRPVHSYSAVLADLAANEPVYDLDIVLAYSGGGIETLPAEGRRRVGRAVTAGDKAEMLEAASALAAKGVEVVLGFGHGNMSVLPDGAALPVGVFEAVSPTAAAEWVLREHVNTRLVDAVPNPGQRRPA